MKYCSNCGHPTETRVPDGDNRPRQVCTHCHTVHYINPRIVTGAVCTWEDQLLLCRRGIEPRYGKWTLPAGFMETGETITEGALRETREESGASPDTGNATLFALIDVPHAEQVHAFYRTALTSPALDPGVESLEARLFHEADIPWDRIAFSTVEATLRWFFDDRRKGHFTIHTGKIVPPTARQQAPGESAPASHYAGDLAEEGSSGQQPSSRPEEGSSSQQTPPAADAGTTSQRACCVPKDDASGQRASSRAGKDARSPGTAPEAGNGAPTPDT